MTSITEVKPGLRPSIGEFKHLSYQTLVDLADWISDEQEYLTEWYNEVADLPEIDEFTIKQMRLDINRDRVILETLERIINEMFEEESNNEKVCEGGQSCRE